MRSLAGAIRARRDQGRLAVIAEVKRRSPAAGPLAAADLPVADLARRYAAAGAAAISVLTEPVHWGGSLDDLRRVREAVDVPLLCKDVIVHPRQLVEARAAGADAALLVAEALDDAVLRELLHVAAGLGLEVLLEAHDDAAFDRVVDSGAAIVGANARDLRDPTRLDRDRARVLAARAPADRLFVAESGIRSAADAAALPQRVDAVLVGEALMRAPDPGALVRSIAAIPRPVPAR